MIAAASFFLADEAVRWVYVQVYHQHLIYEAYAYEVVLSPTRVVIKNF